MAWAGAPLFPREAQIKGGLRATQGGTPGSAVSSGMGGGSSIACEREMGAGTGGEENGPSGARKRGREEREAWVLAEEGFDR